MGYVMCVSETQLLCERKEKPKVLLYFGVKKKINGHEIQNSKPA
jgi:hypothetical protein